MHEFTSGSAPVPCHRKLALAVIVQAFRDAADRRVPPHVRAQAREFLSDSRVLGEWCGVAGLDLPFVKEAVARHFRLLFHVVGPERPQAPPRKTTRTRARSSAAAMRALHTRAGGTPPNVA